MCRSRVLFSLFFCVFVLAHGAEVPVDLRGNLKRRIDVGESPGVIVAVETEGQTAFSAHGQVRDGGAAVDPDTVFEIGSISKTFTALLYEIAVNGALVTPGDEIESLLPAAAKWDPRVASISLGDLATHRSGLPRMPTNFHPADDRNPYADYTIPQFYQWLSSVQPVGSGRFQYSNAGMGLLGHILEVKTGNRYEALLRGWITTPLGLPDTTVSLTSGQKRRLAIPHADGKPLPLWDIPTLAGAGAIRSTARDLLRWASLQAGIIDCPLSAAMRQCQQPQTRTETDGVKAATGWFLTPSKNGTIVWHSGETGGTRSWIGFIRGRKTAAVVLANGTEQIDDIGFHLLSPEMPLREPEKERAVCEPVLRKCEGTFALGKSRLVVKPQGSRLSVQMDGAAPIRAFARSEIEFFFRTANAQLIFSLGTDGRMKSVTLRQNGRDQEALRVSP